MHNVSQQEIRVKMHNVSFNPYTFIIIDWRERETWLLFPFFQLLPLRTLLSRITRGAWEDFGCYLLSPNISSQIKFFIFKTRGVDKLGKKEMSNKVPFFFS